MILSINADSFGAIKEATKQLPDAMSQLPVFQDLNINFKIVFLTILLIITLIPTAFLFKRVFLQITGQDEKNHR